MLSRLSLQLRLSLLLGGLLGLVLIASSIAIILFSRAQLIDELQIALNLARQFSDALNQTLAEHPEAEESLKDLVTTFGAIEPGRLRFVPEGHPFPIAAPAHGSPGTPAWFVELIAPANVMERLPVMAGDRRIGDMLLMPDLSADIFEKWFVFGMSGITGTVLIVAVSVINYWVVRRTLRPVRLLENGLVTLRSGKYGAKEIPRAPPEFTRSFAELNALSDQLHRLSAENSDLLRQLVVVQDDERRDLSRELHDELGPQLFAIRANAVSLVGTSGDQLEAGLQRLADAVEHLQKSNRRILDRLRPLHLEELGLGRSVEELVRDARQHQPTADFVLDFDPRLELADPIVQRTLYRFFQEALTNVLRHAQASEVHLNARKLDGHAQIEVIDDGVGLPKDYRPGRGITGMADRIRALGGTLRLTREDNRTRVTARVPLEPTLGDRAQR